MNTLQDYYERLFKDLPQDAQDVLRKNNLTRIESIELWLIGFKRDFPCEDQEVQNILDDMLRKLRHRLIELNYDRERIDADIQESLETTIESPSEDYNQKRYDEILKRYPKAFRYAKKNGLLNVNDIDKVTPLKTKEYAAFKEVRRLYHNNDMGGLGKDLSDEDILFIEGFRNKNGHYPMFFLLDKYLINSTERENEVVSKYYGLSVLPKSKDELREEYDVSDTTIDNWLSNRKGMLGFILTWEDWNKYSVFDRCYVFENNNDIKNIIDSENVREEAVVCALAMKGVECRYVYKKEGKEGEIIMRKEPRRDRTDEVVLVYPKKYSVFKFKDAIERIFFLSITKRDVHDRIYVIDKEYARRNCVEWSAFNDGEQDSLVSFLIEIAHNFLPDFVNEDGTLNLINYIAEIEAILRDSEGSLKYNDIAKKLLERHPNSRYKNGEDESFRNLILNCPLLSVIGKTGKVNLAERDNKGYIYEIVEEYLNKNGAPIAIKELKDMIIKERPDSNNISYVFKDRRFQRLISLDDNSHYCWFADKDFDGKKFRKYKVPVEENFDERFALLVKYCKENGCLPNNTNVPRLYNFYNGCQKTIEFFEAHSRFPDKEDCKIEGIRSFELINSIPESERIEKLKEVVDSVSAYRRRRTRRKDGSSI